MSLRLLIATIVAMAFLAAPAVAGGGHKHDNDVNYTGSNSYNGGSYSGAGAESGVSGASTEVSLEGSTLTQAEAQAAASRVNSGASAQVVSIGVASCAEAADTLDQNKAASGVLVGSCLDSFQAANGLNATAGAAAANAGIAHAGELTANQTMLGSAAAQKLFDDLNKKYGTDKDAFVKKLVDAKGDPAVLGTQESLNELFNGKITRAQVDEAVEAAGGLSDAEKREILESSVSSTLAGEAQPGELKRDGGVATKVAAARSTTLRDSLTSRLAREESGTFLDKPIAADRKLASGSKPLFPGLQPMEATPFSDEQAANEPAEDNLTLFEVVHLKYQVVSARFAGP